MPLSAHRPASPGFALHVPRSKQSPPSAARRFFKMPDQRHCSAPSIGPAAFQRVSFRDAAKAFAGGWPLCCCISLEQDDRYRPQRGQAARYPQEWGIRLAMCAGPPRPDACAWPRPIPRRWAAWISRITLGDQTGSLLITTLPSLFQAASASSPRGFVFDRKEATSRQHGSASGR